MKKKSLLITLILANTLFAQAQPKVDTVGTITATENTTVHDPVMIQEGGNYYLFCTGWGISFFSSKDLKNWKKEKPVFASAPQWAVNAIPSFKGHIWAPDISYHKGKYYLYYSVSAFGKNTSCIGLTINKTLDPASPDYKWEDQGKLIQSVPGKDMWNAIDANEIDDENGDHWLTFGSFWNGIKLVKLNNDLTAPVQPEEWHTVASRPRSFNVPDTAAGDAAIEAPFIIKKDKYYYLFVSWDYCCRGEKSDYKVVMGRSEKITGPYLDKSGTAMTQNGGSILVQGDNKKWFGAGHNSVYNFEGKYYNIYHGYDAKDKGRSKLIIDQLEWDSEDWPK
jgi:arabinan endo-1,5-alpha-L-arabinosidase